MIRINQVIEERVRRCPEQYLWVHRRFKDRPPGEPTFYQAEQQDFSQPRQIKQRYTPSGGAERFVERALQALQQQQVALTLVTRHWQASDQFTLVRCNPFYLGRLWRDWSFARAACHYIQNNEGGLVQSHERLACCDIYRAGDGVHREWLTQKRRTAHWAVRLFDAANPYHRYVMRAEKQLFGSPRLKAIICNSAMVRQELHDHYGVDPQRCHVIYSGVDIEGYAPATIAPYRQAMRRQWQINDQERLFLFIGSG
ncbi:MAG: UDP-glucose:(heptosyl)LPS alpha-1 3-glucosyltransferase, partial [Halothiobacillaceae bacterium]